MKQQDTRDENVWACGEPGCNALVRVPRKAVEALARWNLARKRKGLIDMTGDGLTRCEAHQAEQLRVEALHARQTRTTEGTRALKQTRRTRTQELVELLESDRHPAIAQLVEALEDWRQKP